MTQRLATCLPPARPLPVGNESSRGLRDGARAHAALIPLVARPWSLRANSLSLIVRPAVARDLEAVATMHSRCSARTLLDRYRTGGRGISVAALQRQLCRPLSFVAATHRGSVVAFAVAGIDVNHGPESAHIGLVVEDEWQGIGIGRELMAHLAASAAVCGYTELIAYTATSVVPMQRLMLDVGRTRVVEDPTYSHLHAQLPDSAALGLGPVRERLAS